MIERKITNKEKMQNYINEESTMNKRTDKSLRELERERQERERQKIIEKRDRLIEERKEYENIKNALLGVKEELAQAENKLEDAAYELMTCYVGVRASGKTDEIFREYADISKIKNQIDTNILEKIENEIDRLTNEIHVQDVILNSEMK